MSVSADSPLVEAYLTHEQSRKLSVSQMRAVELTFGYFRRFLGNPGPEEFDRAVRSATGEDLVRFAAYVAEYRRPNGKPICGAYQDQLVRRMAAFYRFLARTGRLLVDISVTLLPRPARRGLPKPIPTQDEVRRILEAPDVRSPNGLRDRAILEVFYSTGLRRGELVRLEVEDIDVATRVVRVRQGKNKKDRLVPLGQVAARWVAEYLRRIRPAFVREGGVRALFLNHEGGPVASESLGRLVNQYRRQAEVQKVVTCHSLRHAFATHLLQEGAGVRPIQAMLGHASLDSTQIYTRLVPKDVARAIERFHPLETVAPPTSGASPSGAPAAAAAPLRKRPPVRQPGQGRSAQTPKPSAADPAEDEGTEGEGEKDAKSGQEDV